MKTMWNIACGKTFTKNETLHNTKSSVCPVFSFPVTWYNPITVTVIRKIARRIQVNKMHLKPKFNIQNKLINNFLCCIVMATYDESCSKTPLKDTKQHTSVQTPDKGNPHQTLCLLFNLNMKCFCASKGLGCALCQAF